QLLTYTCALSSIAMLSACTTPMLVVQSETTAPEGQGETLMNHSNDSSNPSDQPTVVLVHGAFAESSSWDVVIQRLHAEGYTAIAAANPLRSLSGDAEFVAGILRTIDGPVVLVGHSYGGSVISNAARDNENVQAMVFVAAFA